MALTLSYLLLVHSGAFNLFLDRTPPHLCVVLTGLVLPRRPAFLKQEEPDRSHDRRVPHSPIHSHSGLHPIALPGVAQPDLTAEETLQRAAVLPVQSAKHRQLANLHVDTGLGQRTRALGIGFTEERIVD